MGIKAEPARGVGGRAEKEQFLGQEKENWNHFRRDKRHKNEDKSSGVWGRTENEQFLHRKMGILRRHLRRKKHFTKKTRERLKD